jgi:two-component sensor histidine kinase
MYCDVACGKIGPQSFEIPYEDERFSGYFNVHVFQTGSQSIAVDFTDITSRRHMEEALKRSEIEYRDTLDSLPDWMYVVDDKFNIVMLNASMQQEIIRQGFYQDLVGSLLKVIPPMVEPSDISEIESVFVSGQISITERIFDLAARPAYGVMTLVPILKDGHVMKVVVIIRDKSKEKEIEELKQRNADQKEVLLREIHHRVKNNLAIVISLLNFQLRSNTSSELSKMIIDIQMRIRSMALIHEHLYRSDTLDRIPLDAYIESLAQKILTTFSGHRIRLENDLEHIDVSIETALPIGLIINELLTNAFKYAFPAGTSGVVSIILKHTGQGNCLIIVRDNGIGLPSTIRTDSEKSLGLYIVNLLTEQLEGTLQISTHQGTTFNLNFINRLLCP